MEQWSTQRDPAAERTIATLLGVDELDSHARRDHKEAWHHAAGHASSSVSRGGGTRAAGQAQRSECCSQGARSGHHKGENHAAGHLKVRAAPLKGMCHASDKLEVYNRQQQGVLSMVAPRATRSSRRSTCSNPYSRTMGVEGKQGVQGKLGIGGNFGMQGKEGVQATVALQVSFANNMRD